jgi:hypothetical protein
VSALEWVEPQIFLGECPVHGWHGKTVCPACRETGQIAVIVSNSPSLIYVTESLIRFRGGGREKLRQEARCRMCLRPRGPDTPKEWAQVGGQVGGRTLTRHHIVPERWFKHQVPPTRALRGVDPNVVPLCRGCHDEVEHDREGRRMLRRVLGTEEIAFAIQIAGEAWFDQRYPKT